MHLDDTFGMEKMLQSFKHRKSLLGLYHCRFSIQEEREKDKKGREKERGRKAHLWGQNLSRK